MTKRGEPGVITLAAAKRIRCGEIIPPHPIDPDDILPCRRKTTANRQPMSRGHKILFIFPKWSSQTLWGQLKFKFPPLGLLTIAAMTPARYAVEFVDENVQEMDAGRSVCPDSVGPTPSAQSTIVHHGRPLR